MAGGPSGPLAAAIADIGQAAGGPFGTAAANTIAAMKTTSRYATANSTGYSKSPFGKGMSQIASVINSGAPIEVAAIDFDLNWDTHYSEQIYMTQRLSKLASDLAAFRTSLGTNMGRVTVLCVSEFGRTTVENASAGCDHGRANMVMCMSGLSAQKKVAGPWVGLSSSVTDSQGDLEVQTDFRDVMGEVLIKGMKANSTVMSKVFPGYTPKTVGILR